MKKGKMCLIFLLSLFAFNLNVFAASTSLSVSSNNVTEGDTFTVYANMSSAAAWNIHVSASGPVSGCSINQADATADAMDTNKTFSATCQATGEGTIKITLSGDVTSAEDGNAVTISGTSYVNVAKKVAPAPAPSPSPTPPNNNNNQKPSNPNNNTNNNNNNNTNNPINVSTNNKIKELSVEGQELVKVDDNNYTLTVSNNITSINIKAVAEDAKSHVTGDGKHELAVGENNIEVIVTSEDGLQNKINVKVTRKDGYYMEDLQTILKDTSVKDINIIANENTKITSEDIKKIKDSKKTVAINYYNDEKKLLYSWTIDGNKIKDTTSFSTNVAFNSENIKDISNASNYAEGKYIHFDHSGKLPTGTKIKLYVGDKFSNGNVVNVYYYNKDKKTLESIKKEITVKDEYVEFDIDHCSDYFITMSNIGEITKQESKFNIFIVISIIEAIVLLLIIIMDIFKINPLGKIRKTKNQEEMQSKEQQNEEPEVLENISIINYQ